MLTGVALEPQLGAHDHTLADVALEIRQLAASSTRTWLRVGRRSRKCEPALEHEHAVPAIAVVPAAAWVSRSAANWSSSTMAIAVARLHRRWC
jgi:hypothetical protein